MDNKISSQTKTELLAALRERYQHAAKTDKTQILNEFVAVSGCHRKHAIRLLTQTPATPDTPTPSETRAWIGASTRRPCAKP